MELGAPIDTHETSTDNRLVRRKVDIRLHEKGNLSCHGARPVY